MSLTNPAEFTVFFAWQSDSPRRTNIDLIRAGLAHASAAIARKHGARLQAVVIDEATRGQAGSPNIPLTIQDKIRSADAFVCDLTTINSEAVAGGDRPLANPNVLFELGFAVAHLGWGRVVMLFNRAHGRFPEDLAFDIGQHRASPYTANADISWTDNIDELARLHPYLFGLLDDALSAIVQNAPIRPAEASTLSLQQLHRRHDSATVASLFERIHWRTFDRFLEDAPRSIPQDITFYHANAEDLLSDSLFHLYDPELARRVRRFRVLWDLSLSFASHYTAIPGAPAFVWMRPGDLPFRDPDEAEDWNHAQRVIRSLGIAQTALIGYVRERFPELDLAALSAAGLAERGSRQ